MRAEALRRAFHAFIHLSPGWRWLIWSAYIAAWTTALLVPRPIHAPDSPLLRGALFLFAKSLHVTAYALLAALTAWLSIGRRPHLALLGMIIVHAAGTEYLQYVMDVGREGSWRDVGLNLAGIALGTGIAWRAARRKPDVNSRHASDSERSDCASKMMHDAQ